MGSLQRFDLRKYADHYGLSVFFETGTFQGEGVERAIETSFDRILSVEIIDEFYRTIAGRFAEFNNVKIIHGNSVSALEQILPEIKGNILFWLDAHFPGADGHLTDYNHEQEDSIRCPLEFELQAIKSVRAGREDVFLIDDLRIYECGPFANGDLPANIRRPFGGIDFAYRLFANSHHILKLFDDDGYLLMLPNSSQPKLYIQRTYNEVLSRG